MVKVFCDKCNKDITNLFRVEICCYPNNDILDDSSEESDTNHCSHLCTDCYEKLKRFMNEDEEVKE